MRNTFRPAPRFERVHPTLFHLLEIKQRAVRGSHFAQLRKLGKRNLTSIVCVSNGTIRRAKINTNRTGHLLNFKARQLPQQPTPPAPERRSNPASQTSPFIPSNSVSGSFPSTYIRLRNIPLSLNAYKKDLNRCSILENNCAGWMHAVVGHRSVTLPRSLVGGSLVGGSLAGEDSLGGVSPEEVWLQLAGYTYGRALGVSPAAEV